MPKKIITVVMFLFLVFAPVFVYAQSFTATQEKANCDTFHKQFDISASTLTHNPSGDVVGGSAISGIPQLCSIADVTGKVMNILFGIAGSAAVIFIMIGGFQYLTAAGNDEQSEKAKKILTNALIGLVVIVLAATLVRIIINAVTGNLGTPTATTATPANANPSTNPTANTTAPPPANSATPGSGTGTSCDVSAASSLSANGKATCLQQVVTTSALPPVLTSQAQNINVSFNNSDAAKVAAYCGTSADQILASVYINGSQAGSGTLTHTSATIYSANIPVTATSAGTMTVVVCGSQIAMGDFQVANSTQGVNNSSPQQVQDVLSRDKFTASWSGTNTLNISLADFSSNDINVLCSQVTVSEKTISVSYGGQVLTNQSSVNLKTLSLNVPPQNESDTTIAVTICGKNINGNQATRP